MLKTIMNRLGVGGARLDAVLDRRSVRIGERLTGTLHVMGGDGSLTATHAEVKLMTRVEMDDHMVSVPIAVARINGPIRLEGEHRLPFGIDLPAFTPVTSYGGRSVVWIASELDVPLAVDPKDVDPVEVQPAPEQAAVIAAMGQFGLRLAKTDVEARGGWMGRRFVQEFEFRPAGWGHKLDELELVFEGLSPGRAEVLIQIDRAARGLGGLLREATGMDESWLRASIDARSVETAAADLRRVLG